MKFIRLPFFKLFFFGFVFAAQMTFAQPFQSDYFHLMKEGIVHYEKGEFEKARDSFRGALLLKPESTDAQQNLGLALAKMKEYEAAEEQFGQLSELLKSKELKALQYYHQGLVHFENSVTASNGENGEQPNVRKAIDQALKSLKCFNRALDLKPDYPDAEYNKIQVLHILKELANIVPPEQNASSDEQEEDSEEQEQENQEQQQGDQSQQSSEDQQSESSQSGSQGEQSDSEEKPEQSESQDGQMEGTPPEKKPEESESEEEEQQQTGDGEQNEEEQQDEFEEKTATSSTASDGEKKQGTPVADDATPTMTRSQAEALLQLLGDKKSLTMMPPGYKPELRKGPDW